MSNCTHNCSTCKEGSCKDRQKTTIDFNKDSKVDKVIAVVSGKGGVGKSLVTSMLAICAKNSGLKIGVLDADVTGPSIPKIFGVTENERAIGTEQGLIPVTTRSGVDVMSINVLLEDETKPVVWRGPVISAVVEQFYTDVLWKEKDIIFIDMPPGTGDVPLTVFQKFKIGGIIVVTTPQSLNNMIVEKSIGMANMMNIPVLGIIENMAYYECEDCGKKDYIFGKGKAVEIANKYGLKLLASLPIKSSTARLVDEGNINKVDVSMLNEALKVIMEGK